MRQSFLSKGTFLIFQLLFIAFISGAKSNAQATPPQTSGTLYWTGNVSSDWSDSSNWNPQFVPRNIDTVIIGSGTAVATESASFAAMRLYGKGTIGGSLSVSGSVTWEGGTFSGLVNVASGGVISMVNTSNDLTLTGTLNNGGLVTTGSNSSYTPINLGLLNQGRIDNLGTGLFFANGSHLNITGTTGSVFSNAGTVRTSVANGGIHLSRVAFTNSQGAWLDIEEGDFYSDIGFTNYGAMTTSAYNPSNMMYPPSIFLSGTISGDLPASNNVVRGSGIFIIAGNFTVSGTLQWDSGEVRAKVDVLSGGAICLTNFGDLLLSGTVNIGGLLTTGSSSSLYPGTSPPPIGLTLLNQGRINNLITGLFFANGSELDLNGWDLNFTTGAMTTGAMFTNAGTVRTSVYNSGLHLSGVAFTNTQTGSVEVEQGEFFSDIGFSNYGAMTTSPYNPSTMMYPPRILLSGTILGDLPASNNLLTQSSGAGNSTVSSTQGIVIDNFPVSGTQSVAGNFTVSGTIAWDSGQLGATVNVLAGGAISMSKSSNGDLFLSGTLNNGGLINTGATSTTGSSGTSNEGVTIDGYSGSSGPTLHLSTQGHINNLTTGFLFAQSNGLTITGTTGSAFSNAGILRCEGWVYLQSLGFNNTGLVDVQSGISVDNYWQTAGSLRLSGGPLLSGVVVSSQPLQISGGSIVGSGYINASLINTGGVIKPGDSIGALAISGNYTQSGSGLLDLEISGTAPGTGFDQLSISGQASLGGTLRARFVNGFQPAADQSYQLLSYSSLISNSLALALPALSGGLVYSKDFTASQFTLGVYGSALSSWKHGKFGADANNPAVSGDGVINNPAGINNLVAYALGLDPFTASASNLPASAMKKNSGADYLSFTFNRDTTATDLTYTVEVTNNLNDPNSWTPLAVSTNGAATTGAGAVSETGADLVVTVEVLDTQPVDSTTHRFMRLKVTH